MAVEESVNGLKRLLKDSEDKKMDSITAKQKLLQAFDFAGFLCLKINDPLIWKLIDYDINISRLYIDQYEHFNFDLGNFCGRTLFSWDQYTERTEQEKKELERRKVLTELKRQGKI